MKAIWAGMVVAMILAGAEGAAAQGAGVYWDAQAQVYVRRPGHYVAVLPSPVRQPRRYYVRRVPPPSPTVRVITAPPPAVRVRVVAPVAPTRIVVDGTEVSEERDPYDTNGIVVVGGGVGGIFLFGDGITDVAMGYKLQVGLAVGAAEFALRLDLAPEALELSLPDGAATPAALYTSGASFNYRFLPGATVHPVFGIGLEAIFLDPHEADTETSFAVSGRAGLEFAYPLSDGALALGLDATGHHPFATTDPDQGVTADILSFGAYANYRF